MDLFILPCSRISSDEKEKLFTSVKEFYIKVCDYIVYKFSFKDKLLIQAKMLKKKKKKIY